MFTPLIFSHIPGH